MEGSSPRPAVGNTLASGRLPMLGNSEFAFFVVAHLVALLVVAIADTITIDAWWDFFKWTAVAYILSRGVAKASRVFEH